ncbi:MAG: type II toxin-antitoxin system VapC family toxin [Blastocatellia bacterium]
MAIITYLDANCLIAVADAEDQRAEKVFELLDEPQRVFVYSPFTTLETLPLAIHYQNKRRERFFRLYINLCARFSNNLPAIMSEAYRQAERYGIVGLDACHIAAAITGLADEFYTFEKPTRPMFRTKDMKVISLL